MKDGRGADDVWSCYLEKELQLTSGSKERVGYFSQKPKYLLARIIQTYSNKGDLVADFFCGSGTTGVMAKELGRNYIMCDIGEKAVKTTKKRLVEI